MRLLVPIALLATLLSGCTAEAGHLSDVYESGTGGGYIFILLGFALLGFSHAQASGAVNSSFASRYRYSGALLTSDLSWLTGAAFAPLIALILAVKLGVGYVGLYLLSGAIGTLAALSINRSLELRDDE